MAQLTEDALLDMVAAEAIVDRAKLQRDAKLSELGLASIDVMSVLFEIEEKFGVVIEAGDIPPVETLGQLTDFIVEKVNAESAAA